VMETCNAGFNGKFSIANLASGAYLLYVHSNNAHAAVKIIKP